MGFKQHISRTWQMIEQQVNDVPFRPDNEIPAERQVRKNPYLCGFEGFSKAEKLTPYTNRCRKMCRGKKSHNEQNEWVVPYGIAHFLKKK